MLSRTNLNMARTGRGLLAALRLGLATGLAVSFSALSAAAFDTKARAAYVLDAGTDTVLLEKNADVPLPPASMSKLMTLYVAFEALRDGGCRWTKPCRSANTP